MLSPFPVKDATEGGKFSKRRAGAVQVYSGHLKLQNVMYNQKIEDTKSPEFGALADDLEEIVSWFGFSLLACDLIYLTSDTRVMCGLMRNKKPKS